MIYPRDSRYPWCFGQPVPLALLPRGLYRICAHHLFAYLACTCMCRLTLYLPIYSLHHESRARHTSLVFPLSVCLSPALHSDLLRMSMFTIIVTRKPSNGYVIIPARRLLIGIQGCHSERQGLSRIVRTSHSHSHHHWH